MSRIISLEECQRIKAMVESRDPFQVELLNAVKRHRTRNGKEDDNNDVALQPFDAAVNAKMSKYSAKSPAKKLQRHVFASASDDDEDEGYNDYLESTKTADKNRIQRGEKQQHSNTEERDSFLNAFLDRDMNIKHVNHTPVPIPRPTLSKAGKPVPSPRRRQEEAKGKEQDIRDNLDASVNRRIEKTYRNMENRNNNDSYDFNITQFERMDGNKSSKHKIDKKASVSERENIDTHESRIEFKQNKEARNSQHPLRKEDRLEDKSFDKDHHSKTKQYDASEKDGHMRSKQFESFGREETSKIKRNDFSNVDDDFKRMYDTSGSNDTLLLKQHDTKQRNETFSPRVNMDRHDIRFDQKALQSDGKLGTNLQQNEGLDMYLARSSDERGKILEDSRRDKGSLPLHSSSESRTEFNALKTSGSDKSHEQLAHSTKEDMNSLGSSKLDKKRSGSFNKSRSVNRDIIPGSDELNSPLSKIDQGTERKYASRRSSFRQKLSQEGDLGADEIHERNNLRAEQLEKDVTHTSSPKPSPRSRSGSMRKKYLHDDKIDSLHARDQMNKESNDKTRTSTDEVSKLRRQTKLKENEEEIREIEKIHGDRNELNMLFDAERKNDPINAQHVTQKSKAEEKLPGKSKTHTSKTKGNEVVSSKRGPMKATLPLSQATRTAEKKLDKPEKESKRPSSSTLKKKSRSFTNISNIKPSSPRGLSDSDGDNTPRTLDSVTLREQIYHDWLQRKNSFTKTSSVEKKEQESKKKEEKELEAREKRIVAQKAFQAWSEHKTDVSKVKNKNVKQKKLTEKEKEEEKLQKKVEAKKYFESWKQHKDEILNETHKKKLNEAKEKKKKEFSDKVERSTDAQKTFDNWKARKDESLKEKKHERRNSAKQTKEEEMEKLERKQDAHRAYGSWKERQKKTPKTSTSLVQRPWCPSSRNNTNAIPNDVKPVIVRNVPPNRMRTMSASARLPGSTKRSK